MHIRETNERVHAQMGGPIECHVSQFCLVVAIAMPMLLCRSQNLGTQT